MKKVQFSSQKIDKSPFFKNICSVLLLTFSVEAVAAPALQNNSGQQGFILPPQDEVAKALQEAGEDPLISAIEKDATIPKTLGLPANDPSIDQDPFFMRSQSWSASSEESDEDEPAYETTANAVRIHVPNTSSAWELRAPIHPIAFTDDYILLAANQGSDLFKRASAGLESPGQGVFLVSYQQLQAAAENKAPVSVFFFPLPGDAWEGDVSAHEFAEQSIIVLVDSKGEALPIQLDDIEGVLKAESLNLTISLADALVSSSKDMVKSPAFQKQAAELGQSMESLLRSGNRKGALETYTGFASKMVSLAEGKSLYPARGATAGFGMLYTGYDLEQPDNSTFTAQTRMLKVLDVVIKALSPKAAFADDAAIKKAHDDLIRRLKRIALVIALVFIAGIAMKYTVWKSKFAGRNAKQPKPTTAAGKVVREAKQIGDSFSAVLASFSGFASIWTANLIEAAGDRFLPNQMAGENKLIRKFLKQTVYYTRSIADSTPTNWKAWVYGSLLLGGVDTFFVALQLIYVVPYLGNILGEHVPMLKSRVDNAWDINNPDTPQLNNNEIARNGAGYATAGATGLAIDMRDQLRIKALPDVEEQLRKQGIDINKTENKKLIEDKVAAYIDAEMRKMGFPGPDEFLGDAGTLYSWVINLLGYSVPKGTEGDYHGLKRPGLTVPSVRRALHAAQARLARKPDDEASKAAVLILERLNSNLSTLKSFGEGAGWSLNALTRQDGGNFSQRISAAKTELLTYANAFRKARQDLMLLSYDGPEGQEIRNIPSEWTRDFGKPGAQLAARFFRTALLGYMNGKESALEPTPEQREAFSGVYAESAEKDLITAHYDEFRNSAGNRMSQEQEKAAVQGLKEKYAFEYNAILDKKIMDGLAQEEAVKKSQERYVPEKKGAYARWQERRAVRQTNDAYLKSVGTVFNPNTATKEQQEVWTKIFAEKLMHTVGLHPDYAVDPELRKRVEDRASEMTLAHLEQDTKLKNYMSDLGDNADTAGQQMLISSLYAQNAITAYIENTKNADWTKMPPLSPAQPGRLQKIRQSKIVRKSKALTRSCRLVESMLSNTSYKLGVNAMLERNLPMYSDIVAANKSAYKSAVTSMTGTYAFNYAVWGLNLNPAMWTLQLAVRFTIGAPSRVVTRMFQMQGFAPLGKIHMMLLFGFVYTWATFWGSIPQQLFAEDWKNGFNYVTKPLSKGYNWIKQKSRLKSEEADLAPQGLAPAGAN